MGQYLGKIDNYFKAFDKAKREFENQYPSIKTRLNKREDNFHLNIIDRTIFLIRLREFYHEFFIEILGPDCQDEITQFETSDSLFKSKQGFFLNDYILHLDQELIQDIDKNLRTVKNLYLIGNKTVINNRPFTSLLNYPNRLIISVFIFPVKEWINMILLEIEKLYGKKNTKKHLTASDDYTQVKYLLRTLPREIEERIGTNQFKIYNGLASYAYHNINSLQLGYMLERVPINKLLGNLNNDDKIIHIKKLEQDRAALYFNWSSKKLYPIFKTFFCDFLNLREVEFKDSLKLFLEKHSLGPVEIENNWSNYIDLKLHYIDDSNITQLFGFLRFLEDKNIAKHFIGRKTAKLITSFTSGEKRPNSYKTEYSKSKISDSLREKYSNILRA